jgi:hypothetical protein
MFPSQPQPKPDSPKNIALAWTLLRKYPDRMQVLTEFCEKTRMDPAQAEALLRRVESAFPKGQPLPGVGTSADTARSRILLMVALAGVLVIGMAVWAFLMLAR